MFLQKQLPFFIQKQHSCTGHNQRPMTYLFSQFQYISHMFCSLFLFSVSIIAWEKKKENRASFQMHGICCLYRNILCQLDILQGASDINAVIPMF